MAVATLGHVRAEHLDRLLLLTDSITAVENFPVRAIPFVKTDLEFFRRCKNPKRKGRLIGVLVIVCVGLAVAPSVVQVEICKENDGSN